MSRNKTGDRTKVYIMSKKMFSSNNFQKLIIVALLFVTPNAKEELDKMCPAYQGGKIVDHERDSQRGEESVCASEKEKHRKKQSKPTERQFI